MEGVKAPRQERSAATRDRIVTAARDLFREEGYEAVSTAEVLRRAGVSRGALYHHFAGKDEVLLAVFEEIEAETMVRVGQRLSAETDPFAAMKAGAQAYLDECLGSVETQRIGLLYARRVLPWDTWREMATRHGLGLAIAITTEAARAGKVRSDDPEALAHLIVAALIEAGTMIAFADDQEAERARTGAAIDALLEGLRPP
ncbi:MAG: TetR/AcrR family transcriptional regulator [Actinomycetota bacterium]